MARYTGQVEPQFSRLHEDKDLLWIVPFRVRYILGISGLRYSGKSAAISHLTERRDFKLYGMTITLRRLAAAQGVSPSDRTAMQDFGDEQRRIHNDPGYLARLTLREIRRDHLSHTSPAVATRIVVGGFKRLEEVEVFRSIHQFQLFGLTTEDNQRYDRAIDESIAAHELGLVDDEGTVTEFPTRDDVRDQLDHRDRYGLDSADRFGQHVQSVVDNVDPANRITNDDRLSALYRTLDARVDQLDQLYRRPRG